MAGQDGYVEQWARMGQDSRLEQPGRTVKYDGGLEWLAKTAEQDR